MKKATPDDNNAENYAQLRLRIREWRRMRFEVRGARIGKRISTAAAVVMGTASALDIIFLSGTVSAVFSGLFALKAGEHTFDAVVCRGREERLREEYTSFTRQLHADLKAHRLEKRQRQRPASAPPVSALLKIAGSSRPDFETSAMPPEKAPESSKNTPTFRPPAPPSPPTPAL